MSCSRIFRFLATSLTLWVWACSSPTPSISVIGRWQYSTPEDANYPELLFRDTTALFSSRGDTLYRFRYVLDEATHTVQLTDVKGQQWRVHILRVDADSLIVDHLHEKKGVQRYSRLPN